MRREVTVRLELTGRSVPSPTVDGFIYPTMREQ